MNHSAPNKRDLGAAPERIASHTLSVRRSFDRAGGGYDAAAVLQAVARESLLRRLDPITITPRVILDAGAGTGHASEALQRRYPESQVIALDSAFGMLREASRRGSLVTPFHKVCADAEHLPLAAGSVDLVISNLMLQWCHPDAVFAEFGRALAPQGRLNFTTLGPGTLHELRAAWAAVDSTSNITR